MTKPAYRIDIQRTCDDRYMAWVTPGYTGKHLALGVGETPLAAAHDARAEMRKNAGF